MMTLTHPHLTRAREHLQQAERAVVFTGAGISAESGIPTFRGPDGLWRQYRAEELATPEAFTRDPKLVWEFYHSRRVAVMKASPNAAHRALADLERHKPKTLIVTQNVDGLHQAAGSQNVLELHGSLWRLRCPRCGLVTDDRRVDLPPLLACERCQGLLRPDVVWFGEPLDAVILATAEQAAKACELMLIVGTSGLVYPASGLVYVAKEAGAFLIEVNPNPSLLSEVVDVVLQDSATAVLPALVT